MKKQPKPAGKLSLKTELSRKELKQITGGALQQTYCDGHGGAGPFPNGQQPIGCQPAYCSAAGHGAFLYCA
ncbi:MAG TPA: bacteriocin [Mucilaginibacter sp.]